MIYLDNSATTPLCGAAKAAMIEAMEVFGNPSSLHAMGLEAQKRVQEAREVLLEALGVRNRAAYRLIFTASGSEANNQLLFGAFHAKHFRFTPRIVTTNSEHPSVLTALEEVKRRGAEVVYLSTKNGAVSLDEVKEAVNENTVLLSIMTVNNETGAVYDLKSLFAAAKRKNPNLLTHTDCVQGFMKVRFSPEAVGADAVTVSAHKIHGPKGMGALLVSQALLKAKRVTPLIYGGGQEGGLRSGTENVVGIVGFAAAAKVAMQALPTFEETMKKRREAFLAALPEGVRVNTPVCSAPHIISLTLPGVRSETMLHYLSSEGIFVSSGSACASNKKNANYVLPAFGLSPAEADSTLRISLSADTTEEELRYTAEKLGEGLRVLIHR